MAEPTDPAAASSAPAGSPAPPLASLLEHHQPALLRIVWRHARSLLRYEKAEDLLQEINLCALQVADRFVYQGEKPFLGWLAQVARQRIAARYRSQAARQRNLGQMLRVTGTVSSEGGQRNVVPSARERHPSSHARMREDLALVGQVLTVLLPRDRDLLLWMSAGVPVEEMARRLGLSRDSTNRAKLRAVERARSALAAISNGQGAARRQI